MGAEDQARASAARDASLWMFASASSFSVMSFTTYLLRDSFSWQTIAVIRTAIALVLTIAIAKSAGAQLVLFRPATLWIRSLAGSVALLANFYSMTHHSVAEVLALSNMFPLWVAMLSWPVLGEKPPASAWLATAVGIAGVYLLSLGEGRSDPQTFSIVPILTALLASVASAIALLGLHHLKQVSTSAVVAHFSGVSLVCSGLAMLAPAKAFTSEPTSADWFLLSLVGVSATFGQLFLTKAFAAGSPAKISVISLSQVGFAMLMQIVFLGHRFNPLTVGGIALVVAPTAWVLLRRQ